MEEIVERLNEYWRELTGKSVKNSAFGDDIKEDQKGEDDE